jgi:uncharacterized membrane protein
MIGKNRLEAFSDGVFAIVITLLVLDVHLPIHVPPGQSLAHALGQLWPQYIAYAITFAQVGVIWLNHHRVFQQVKLVDGPLLLLNLNLLLWVALLPFPASVVADYLSEGGTNATTALALYGGAILVTAISFCALYLWLTHDDRLVVNLPPPDAVRKSRVRFMFGLGAYGVAFALSWVSAPLALSVHGAMALYYAFDQATLQQVPEPAG